MHTIAHICILKCFVMWQSNRPRSFQMSIWALIILGSDIRATPCIWWRRWGHSTNVSLLENSAPSDRNAACSSLVHYLLLYNVYKHNSQALLWRMSAGIPQFKIVQETCSACIPRFPLCTWSEWAKVRSRAMTAQAPASSAIFACSLFITSMMTSTGTKSESSAAYPK